MEIIVTHISSDFDAFAALIAAKKIYPRAHIILPTSINQNVRRFMAFHEDELPPPRDVASINLKKVTRMIAVDTRIPSRLGPARAALANKGIEVLVYDHHQKTGQDIESRFDYSQDIGATTTLLVGLIRKKNIDISPLEATLFALGIYEDTGSFTYPGTTWHDLEAAAYLLSKGANLYVLNRFHNISLSEDQHKLLENLIDNSEKVMVKGKEILLSHAQVDGYVEGLSVLTRKLSQIEDINTVICWARMKGKVYVVARSYDKSVNVSDILDAVGGGGHPQAASAVAGAKDFGTIRKKIITSLEKKIKRPAVASDIMSYPVRFVKENESIQQVDKILKKYGHSGIPIVDVHQKLVGIITRKDIDKAINHGLAHAPVKGFKSHGVITAAPDSTIDHLQSLMIENGIGRIPIVGEDKIIGIVTRKDILRHLHGQDFDRRLKVSLGESEKMKSHFPSHIWSILKLVSVVSEELGYRVYLVGGIVRDILLKIPNLDIDIVVEGDGIKLARELQQRIGCRVETHHKFKTAVLVLSDDLHLDIATARVEYYESPAALPTVESGSIKQDLSRRDFTINAMAISLNEGSFGRIIDFFGGRKDLENKTIKALHKMSFIEDPTRIFRGVRFEQRLGFSIDPQTEKLIRTTIEMDMVSKLTGVRIRDELVAILNEKNPWKPLKRLHELGALEKIGLNVKIEEDFMGQIKRVLGARKKLKPFTGDIKKWRLLFVMLLKNQPLQKVKKWCLEMKVRQKDAQVIINTVLNWDMAAGLLKKEINKNSILYRAARRFSDELLIICSTWGDGYKKNVIRYLKNLQNISLEIDGSTLIKLGYKPSPSFRGVLDELLDLKLDGLVTTREEEISQAKKLFEAQGDRGST